MITTHQTNRRDLFPDHAAAIDGRRDTLYTPWFWWWIMLVVRLIPEPLFKRLRT